MTTWSRSAVVDLVRTHATDPQGWLTFRARATPTRAVAEPVGARAQPGLAATMAEIDAAREGLAAVFVGLLLETDDAALRLAVAAAVRDELGPLLHRWDTLDPRRPGSLALLFLLSHLPDDRVRILGSDAVRRLDPADRSRLERALATLDPASPDLGRVFPFPDAWTMDAVEQQHDRAWIESLTSDQVARHWALDTETVLGHTGAQAYWAAHHGSPAPVVPDATHPRSIPDADGGPDILGRVTDVLCCPTCRSALDVTRGVAACLGCDRRYPVGPGVVDFATSTGAAPGEDFLYRLSEMPSMGYFYETFARPNFLRVAGSNWDGAVTPADEDSYIGEHVRPVAGPVLDLAAGAGRWTTTLAASVGAQRVVALDLGPPMIASLRARLPEIPALLAGAGRVPAADASLGAVLCWNALQAFPQDARAAIAEVGRCLRPGGTFSFMTFRNSDDPVYRYFVGRHHFPQHPAGLRLFDQDDVMAWVAEAGLLVRHLWTPGTFLFVTAERPS